MSDNKMNNYEEAKKIVVPMLKKHEGVETKPYYCTAGKLTIGVGRNLESIGISKYEAAYFIHFVNLSTLDDYRLYGTIISGKYSGKDGVKYYCRNLDRGISEIEINCLLKNDINRVVEELDQNVPLQDISSNRMAALIDMCFNIGLTSFLKFKNMLAALDNQDYELAAKEMLSSKWAKQVGQRAIDLSEILRTDKICGQQ